jgi:hypothetical protein
VFLSERKPNLKTELLTIITIKAPIKLQTGSKEFQTEYIQSSKYAARLKSSGYPIPKVVEKRLGQVEQTGLNKYRKTLEALMSFQVPAGTGSHFDNSRVNIDYKLSMI